MTPCFAVRGKVLRELLADKEFVEKVKKAAGMVEVAAVFDEFCRKKGYKVAT